MSVVKTARGCAGTFDPRLSGKGVGGFLQEPFAEVDTRSPASPGAWHEDRRPDGSLLFVLSSESHGSSSARVRNLLVHTGRSRCGHVRGILMTMVQVLRIAIG